VLDLGYTPYPLSEALTLAVRAGALESVRILLTHPSLADYGIVDSERYVEWVKSLALETAAELGFVEAMKSLLADHRLSSQESLSSIIRAALTSAVKADRPESVDFLLPLSKFGLNQLANEAARSGSRLVLEMIYSKLDKPDFMNHLRSIARSTSIPASRSTPTIDMIVSTATDRGVRLHLGVVFHDARKNADSHTDSTALITHLLTYDSSYIAEQTVQHCLRLSQFTDPRLVRAFLNDSRTQSMTSADMVELLDSSLDIVRVLPVILSAEQLDLNDLDLETVEILTDIVPEVIVAIREAGRVSGQLQVGYNPSIVVDLYKKQSRTFYERLLIEIVFKRLDLAYYLDWIIAQLPQLDLVTRSELRDAARSVREPLAHTSPNFTAYSGFMLLAIETNPDTIMNTLQLEGASPLGLERAGMLIGAFLSSLHSETNVSHYVESD
ncbi:Hypothetical protein POVR2_LOCUS86, partial [uncultured virus]